MSDISNEKSSPWDSDLETVFEDEDTRRAVSEFLGEKVQPYVTKLETESKPDRDAQLLWEQFHESPVDTSIQVVKELFGDEKADEFIAILQGSEEAPESDDVQTETTTPPDTQTQTPSQVEFDQLPPEVQKIVQDQKLEESRKAYYGEIDRIKTEHADELPKDAEGNPRLEADVFHPFVVAAEGNFDAAFEGFQNWITAAMKEAGVEVPAGEGPPPVIDSRTRDSSQRVATEPKHQTLDGALDEMFDELKAPPPTVGAV